MKSAPLGVRELSLFMTSILYHEKCPTIHCLGLRGAWHWTTHEKRLAPPALPWAMGHGPSSILSTRLLVALRRSLLTMPAKYSPVIIQIQMEFPIGPLNPYPPGRERTTLPLASLLLCRIEYYSASHYCTTIVEHMVSPFRSASISWTPKSRRELVEYSLQLE